MDEIINSMIESVMTSGKIIAFAIQEIEDNNLGETAMESLLYSMVMTLYQRHPEIDLKRLVMLLYAKIMKGENADEKDL